MIDLCGGTLTFPNVTSLDGSLSPQAVNGVLYVSLKTGGTLLIFR